MKNMVSRLVAIGSMAAAVAGLPTVATAADVPFPNKDGSGDLSSTAAWDSDPIPDATYRVLFSASMTATALADIDFAGLYLLNAGTSVILDMRPETAGGSPRQINLSGAIAFAREDQSLTIRGGRWNMNNKNVSLYTAYDSHEARRYVSFSDGAVVENAKVLSTSYGAGGSGLRFDGSGTSVGCAKLVTTYGGSNGNIEIVNGACVTVTGTEDASLRIGNSGHDNALVVSDGASLVSSSSVASINMGTYNDQMRVLAGGVATIDGGYGTLIAQTATTNSLVEVDGDGSTLSFKSVYFGSKNGGCSNNVIRVSNGGLLTYYTMFLSGRNNGIVVSNAAVVAKTSAFAKESGSDASSCFLRMQGASPCFAQTSTGASDNTNLFGGFRFIFDIPADGYDLSEYDTPVTFNKWATGDGTWDVEISRESLLAAIKQMSANEVRTRTYKLIRFAAGYGNSGIPDEQVQRWQSNLPANLPPNSTVTLNREGGLITLTLDVKAAGLTMFVR